METTELKFMNDLKNFFLSIQKYAGSTQCIFLSQRFYDTYSYLKREYPELMLANFGLLNDTMNQSEKIIYLNDINYDFPKRRSFSKEDVTIIYNYCATPVIPYKGETPRVTRQDIKIDEKNRKFCRAKNIYLCKHRLNHHHVKFVKKVSSTNFLQTLGLELKILQDSGIEDPISLLPDFLQNYFHFIIDNQEYLSHFLDIYYLHRSLSDYYATLPAIVIDDMIQCYGKENISPELIEFLMGVKRLGRVYLMHYPINQGSKMVEDFHLSLEDGKIKRMNRS